MLKKDNWIAYLLIGIIVYTIGMIDFFEHTPMIASQINSSIIIGLLMAILLKLHKP